MSRPHRDVQQIQVAAAREIQRRFGALGWLCAWSGVWRPLLPTPLRARAGGAPAVRPRTHT